MYHLSSCHPSISLTHVLASPFHSHPKPIPSSLKTTTSSSLCLQTQNQNSHSTKSCSFFMIFNNQHHTNLNSKPKLSFHKSCSFFIIFFNNQHHIKDPTSQAQLPLKCVINKKVVLKIRELTTTTYLNISFFKTDSHSLKKLIWLIILDFVNNLYYFLKLSLKLLKLIILSSLFT